MSDDTPVLDTLTDITAVSIDHSMLSPRDFVLARSAARDGGAAARVTGFFRTGFFRIFSGSLGPLAAKYSKVRAVKDTRETTAYRPSVPSDQAA